MAAEKKEKVSNSEVIDLLVNTVLQEVVVLTANGMSDLVIRRNNNITPFPYAQMEAAVDTFLLKNFDMIGQNARSVYRTALSMIKTNSARHVTEEVLPIAFKSDNVPAWIVVDNDKAPIKLSDLAEFQLFLDQTSPVEQQSIIMWIGSLLDSTSNRRQYLHLYGDGAEGKSTLIEALNIAFAGQTVGVTARQLQSAHFGPELEGKRLYIFSDENNSTFFSSGAFKSLTGDNNMTVNPKGQPVRTIRLIGKAVVCSNNEAQIEDNHADKTRIISVKLTNKPKSVDWYDNFIAKSVELVLYCHQEYVKAIKNNPELHKTLPSSGVNTASAVNKKSEYLEDIFADNFVFAEECVIKRSTANKVFSDNYKGAPDMVVRREVGVYLARQGIAVVMRNGIAYYQGIELNTAAKMRYI